MATWNYAGCGTSGVSDYNGISTDNTSCGFLDDLSHVQTSNVRYAPKLTIVTSGPVAQDVYTWKASGSTGVWDEEAFNWTLKDEDSKYVSDPKNIVNFNEGGFAKEVTVDGEIAAYVVNVRDNYKFTIGTGDSLSISKLSVASGATATVENAGELSISKLSVASGATATVENAGELSISTITGEGAFTKGGVGTLNLAGTNDFSGGLTVSGGVVHTTQVSALGTGTLRATGSGVIEIENTAPGNLTVLGDGTLRLMTTYAASSQQSNVELANIQAEKLSLGADEHHSSRFRNQNNPNLSKVGHLYFDGGQFWLSNDLTYGGSVTFNETVYKEVRTSTDDKLNDAALRVNANATFTGAVDVAHDTRFTWQDSGKTVEFGGTVTGSGDLELVFYGDRNNNTFKISGNASAYAGAITTVPNLTLDVTGSLSVGADSRLAGAVVVEGSGLLDLTSSVSTGALTVASGATLKLAGAGADLLSVNGNLTLAGNLDVSRIAYSAGTTVTLASYTGAASYAGATVTGLAAGQSGTLGVDGNNHLTLTFDTPPTPKEGTFHVYILTGQSNSLGAVKGTPLPDGLLSAYEAEGVLMYNANITSYPSQADIKNAEANPQWVQLAPQKPEYSGNNCMGPEYGFAYVMQQHPEWYLNAGESEGALGVVLASLDGGGNQYWDKSNAATSYTYDNILQNVKNALTAAASQGYEAVSLDGLMYLQGESNKNGGDPSHADTLYQAFINNLKEDLDTWLATTGLDIKVTFDQNNVAGEPATWTANGIEGSNEGGTVTAEKLLGIATKNGQINADENGIGFVYTRDLAKITSGDQSNVHYRGTAQLTIGARYAYAFAVQNGIDVGTVRGQDDSATLDTAAAWWMEILPTADDVAVWDISSVSQSIPVPECNKIADGQSITVGGIRIEEVYAPDATTKGQGSVAITGGSINLGNASLESGSGITLVGGDLSISSTINAVANQTWSTGDHQLTTSGTVNIQNGATLTIAGDAEWQFNVVQGTGNLVVTNGATLSMTQADLNNHSTGGSSYSDGNNGFLSSGYDLITLTGDNSSITINPTQITWDGALAGKDITLSADSKKLQILNGESTVYHVRDGVVVYNTATGITGAASIDINDMGSTGATLRLSAPLAEGVQLTSSGNGGAVSIDSEVTLSQTSLGTLGANISLAGSGTFAVTSLNSGGLPEHVALQAGQWTGTVRLANITGITGYDIKLNSLGNANSTVEFEGVTAYLNTSSTTYNTNLKFTGTGLKIDAGNSNGTYTFNGSVSGNGTLNINEGRGSDNHTYVFAGDLSQWTGEFLADNDGKTNTVKFTGNAHLISADITKTAGTLHLSVDTDATFNGNVTNINNFTVAVGKTATFNGTTSINGASSIGGTVYNNGAMTLNGAVTVDTTNLSSFEMVGEQGAGLVYDGVGDYAGNGHVVSGDVRFYLVKAGNNSTITGTYSGSGVTLATQGNSVVFSKSASDLSGVYFVNKDLEWGDSMGGTSTERVVVASRSTLTINSLVGQSIQGSGTVKIACASRSADYQYHDQNFLENFAGTVEVARGVVQLGSQTSKFANATLVIGTDGSLKGWNNDANHRFVHDITLKGGTLGAAGNNMGYKGAITLTANSTVDASARFTTTLEGTLSGQYKLTTSGDGTVKLSSSGSIGSLNATATTVVDGDLKIGYLEGNNTLTVNVGKSLVIDAVNDGGVTNYSQTLTNSGILTLGAGVESLSTLVVNSGATLALTQQGDNAVAITNLTMNAGSILDVSSLFRARAGQADQDIILAKGVTSGSDWSAVRLLSAPEDAVLRLKGSNLVLTMAAEGDLYWKDATGNWGGDNANQWYDSATATSATLDFSEGADVYFTGGSHSVTMGAAEHAGTMTLLASAAVTINTTADNSLTVDHLAAESGASLTKSGAGTATFGGAEGVSLQGLTVRSGTAEFAPHVTITGNPWVTVNGASTLKLLGGLSYTGNGNSNNYALQVTGNSTAILGGTTELPNVHLGAEAGSTIQLADNANVMTKGVIWSSTNVDSNGNVVLGDNATLRVTDEGIYTPSLSMGAGSVLNIANFGTSTSNIKSVSGSGRINLESGVLTMDGSSPDYSGTITVSGGTLAISATNFGGKLAQTGSGIIRMKGDVTDSITESGTRIEVEKISGQTLTLKDGAQNSLAKVTVNSGDGAWLFAKGNGASADGKYTDIVLNAQGLILTETNKEVHIGNLSGSNSQIRGDYDGSGGEAGRRVLVVHQTEDSTFGGTFTDHGGNRHVALTKQGTGTLTLTGANASTNTMTVNEGKVVLSGSGKWAGDVVVNGGGTLALGSDVTTVSTTLAFAEGATFKLSRMGETGDNAAVTIGNLTMASGSILDLSSLGLTGEEDMVTLARSLGSSSTTDWTGVRVNFGEQTYQGYTLGVSNHSLVLTFAEVGDTLIWGNHTGNGYWSNAGDDTNWHRPNNVYVPDSFKARDRVQFTGRGTTTVTLKDNVAPTDIKIAGGDKQSLTLNTKGNNLTVVRGIAGAGASLVLNSEGSDGQQTSVRRDVTLKNLTVIDGNLSLGGTTKISSNLLVQGGGKFTADGDVAASAVAVVGNSSAAFDGALRTDRLNVTDSQIGIGGIASVATLTMSNSQLKNTGLLDVYKSASVLNGGNTITGSGTMIVRGMRLENGTTTITGGQTLSLTDATGIPGNVPSITGTAGQEIIELGDATLSAVTDSWNIDKSVDSVVLMDSANGTTVHAVGHTLGIAANISGTGRLVKTGTGTLELSGTNEYFGGTDVQAGTLLVSSANALPGSTTVASGARLVLSSSLKEAAKLSSLTINGGTLSLAGSDMLDISGTLTMADSSRLDLTNLVFNSNVTKYTLASGGTINLNPEAVALTFQRGVHAVEGTNPSISVIGEPGRQSLVLNIQLDTPNGMVWDGGTSDWNMTDAHWHADGAGTAGGTVFRKYDDVVFDGTNLAGGAAEKGDNPELTGNVYVTNMTITRDNAVTVNTNGYRLDVDFLEAAGGSAFVKEGTGTASIGIKDASFGANMSVAQNGGTLDLLFIDVDKHAGGMTVSGDLDGRNGTLNVTIGTLETPTKVLFDKDSSVLNVTKIVVNEQSSAVMNGDLSATHNITIQVKDGGSLEIGGRADLSGNRWLMEGDGTIHVTGHLDLAEKVENYEKIDGTLTVRFDEVKQTSSVLTIRQQKDAVVSIGVLQLTDSDQDCFYTAFQRSNSNRPELHIDELQVADKSGNGHGIGSICSYFDELQGYQQQGSFYISQLTGEGRVSFFNYAYDRLGDAGRVGYDSPEVFYLGGESKADNLFSGTIQLYDGGFGVSENSKDKPKHTVLVLEDEIVASQSVITINNPNNGNDNKHQQNYGKYSNFGIGIDADNVKVQAITDTVVQAGNTVKVFSGTVGEDVHATYESDDDVRTLQLTGKAGDTASTVYNSSAGFDKNVNIVKEGAGKQVFKGDSSNFNADIDVKEGILEFLNNNTLYIEDLTLAAGGSAADKTLKIRTDANEAIAAPAAMFLAESDSEGGSGGDSSNGSNVGMADVHGTMTAKAGSALDSNLTMNVDAVLDVSGAVTQQYSEIGGNKYDYAGGLNMLDNSLTLHSGAYLSTTDLNRLLGMTWGEKYELAYKVGTFYLGDGVYTKSMDNPLAFSQDEHNTAVEASKYFENLQEEDYYICYTGSGVGVNGSNVGVVYIFKAPEPTTGTLSLLALAALCARRRRKA